MPCCYLALGGNTGTVETTFQRALEQLADHPRVRLGQMSTLHRFDAVGAQAGSEFLNAAAEVCTEMPAVELLDLMQSVETALQRRREIHWGPRTLDLDLILYGQEIVAEPRLRVPHPAAWYRRFVLDPLVEIAADAIHPVRQLSIASLRDRLLPRPLPVALVGHDTQTRETLAAGIRQQFPLIDLRLAGIEDATGPLRSEIDPAALVIWLGGAPSSSADRIAFESLPANSRLDAATLTSPLPIALRYVIESALGID